MNIAGFQKLSLLDYKGYLSCLIFTQGCNLNCPFCHNSKLIKFDKKNLIDEQEIFEYLDKRKNIITAVVISGGEPLLQNDIMRFIKKIKKMGFKVKLDTNGSMPDKLLELINKNMLDYVAMDLKNDFNNYEAVSGVLNIDVEKIKKSIEILKNSKIEYEFRTTIMKEYHNIENLKKILDLIGKEENYYLQNIEISKNVINKKLTAFNKDELVLLEHQLKIDFPNISIRGI